MRLINNTANSKQPDGPAGINQSPLFYYCCALCSPLVELLSWWGNVYHFLV